MINIVGIIIMLVIYASLFIAVIRYYKNCIELKDIELVQRDKELGKRTATIKDKNFIIKQQDEMIRNLENEIKELKRKCNKRLR